MSKKNLEKKIMEKIKTGQIKMRPKVYFIAGSLILFLGVVAVTVVSFFVFNILFFIIRRGFISQRAIFMLNSFPWWLLIIGILAIIVGIKIIKEYEFSYKKNFGFIVIFYVLVIIISAYLIDFFGINRLWYQRGPFKRFYQQNQENFFPRPRRQFRRL